MVVNPSNLVLMQMNDMCQIWNETPERAEGAKQAMSDLYEVVTHGLLSPDLRYMVYYILISIFIVS